MIASTWRVIDSLLRTYPRVRTALPEAHRRLYEREYRLNRDGLAPIEGLAKYMESWMHRKVAQGGYGDSVLELGAGTLNHIAFEPVDQLDYDVVEPFTALYVNSPRLKSVRDVYSDIEDIPQGRRYARIISVAVLEHLTHLPFDLARSGLMLGEGGVFQAGIPSEGGILWWLGWRCTTGLSYFLRNGLDYGVLMRHEHVNRADEIIAAVRYFYEDVKLCRFPLPAHHLSLYGYIEARNPRLDRCRNMLAD